MKYRSARSCFTALALAGLSVSGFISHARAAILTSNLSLPTDGPELISSTRWLASQFSTDGNSYLIDSVSLRLQQNVKGTVQVSLFSDAGGQPGELILTLTQNGGIGINPGTVTFRNPNSTNTRGFSLSARAEDLARSMGLRGIDTNRLFGRAAQVHLNGDRPNGLGLDPDTNYWIVTRALNGQFSSGYTDSEKGDGVGYTPNWAHSENRGASWTVESQSPLFIEVLANPSDLLVTDQEAITSAIFSGLPMAMAQREAVFSMVRNVTRDVNERLFRLRSESDPETKPGWEVFATASYGSSDAETFLPAAGFQTDTFSETAGAEYRVNEHLTFGGAFTYIESQNALALGIGDADIEGESLAAYASYHAGGLYVDALYGFSSFEHDLQRHTFFGNTAHAEPNSKTHTLQLNLGYNMEVAGFVTGPYATIDWMIGQLEEYTEAGASTSLGNARLHVPGQSFDSLISRIGWQISRTFTFDSVKFTPQFRAGWAHEYRDDNEFVGVSLVRSPYQMQNQGALLPLGHFEASAETQRPGSDVFEIGVAFGLTWRDRFELIVDYSARLLQNNAKAHQVSLTGSLKF
jgi:outer membrane autotransporter protein